MADLIQSVGVMVAGGIIWAKPEWLMVDLVCTLCFSVLVLTTTLTMLRNIFSILMERAPIEIDIAGLENGLKSIKGVQDVHDLHVWAITVGKVVMSCHVIAEPGATSSEILGDIRDYCEKTYRILHTIQVIDLFILLHASISCSHLSVSTAEPIEVEARSVQVSLWQVNGEVRY
ncbi:Metal tolerance protein B [Vitis vinifera]|uniref:Metal tolerance protein B n=1 Tax=Vitis vinifera TaxID=29760 RepID=A0A438F9L1_VITVI|nr:Metal tolerance protein B [Vitis vinifera]